MDTMWVDMETKVEGAEPWEMVEKWGKHCIFRVPSHFRVVHGDVFKPRLVALGPYHHNDAVLHRMEEHKLRAVGHLRRRSGKTLGELVASVEEVAGELEDAYEGLGVRWRGENRGRFIKMMFTDGCFLLDLMRCYSRLLVNEEGKSAPAETFHHEETYAQTDPIFGAHAIKHISAFVRRDMLMIENQLPLILLYRIVAAEGVESPNDVLVINKLVHEFLCVDHECDTVISPEPGLHPLALYRRSILSPTAPAAIDQRCCCIPIDRDAKKPENPQEKAAPRSARKLWEAGIRFECTATSKHEISFLNDISFDPCRRMLKMPRIVLDDSTEFKYRNVMAFEALYAGDDDGNDVTAFVLFMRELIDSTDDVELLRKQKVLDNDLAGDDKAVVRLFNSLTKDVAKNNTSRLCGIRRQMEDYCNKNRCRVFVFESWATLKNTYLSSPWAFIALVAAIFLLCADVVQTIYAVLSYELDKKCNNSTPPHK